MKNVILGVISGGVSALVSSSIVGAIEPERLLTRVALVGVLTAVFSFVLLMYVFRVGKKKPSQE